MTGKTKRRRTFLVFLALMAIGMMVSVSCATSAFADDPLDTVFALDVERYLGRWYEIARFPHSFEKRIVGATAEYSLRDDGRIQVVNSGFRDSLDGKYTSVKAVAWRPDDTVPGALKVRFFGLFSADYLVFGLGDSYEWALVGSNDRRFLWFLSRTPTIDDEVFSHMKLLAEEQGYDLADLYLVPQKQR